MREYVWEGLLSALSWIVAIVVLACLGTMALVDAAKRRQQTRQATAAVSMTLEMAP